MSTDGFLLHWSPRIGHVGNANRDPRHVRAGTPPPGVVAVPAGTGFPTDTDRDGLYDDADGRGRKSSDDAVLSFDRPGLTAPNRPITPLDCIANGRIDFADVVRLFIHL
jgi:PKD repeat protein